MMSVAKGICTTVFSSPPSGLGPPWGLCRRRPWSPKRTWRLALLSNYFEAISTFDAEGEEEDLPGGGSFAKMDVDLGLSYGFGKRVELSVGGRWRQVAQSQGEESWSESALESAWGAIKVPLVKKMSWALTLEGRYASTLYEQQGPEDRDTPPLGDAGKEVQGLAHVSYRHGEGTTLTLTSGYRTRPGHLSSEVPYRAAINIHGRSWAFSLGGSGVVSLDDDDYKDNPEARPKVAGVSGQFNGLNRSFVRPFVGGSYAFALWRVGLEAGMVSSGVSTDKGIDVGLSFVRSHGRGGVECREKN